MITVERRSVKMRRGVITSRGYLLCGQCADKSKQLYEHVYWFTEREGPTWGSWSDKCDTCGVEATNWIPETVHGTAVVEHVPCKIF
jgi:hypothetical protein